MNQQARMVPMLGLILTCLLFFQDLSLAARKVELTLRWSELQPHIGQRNVAVVLPDGVHLAGKVMEIHSGRSGVEHSKELGPEGPPERNDSHRPICSDRDSIE